MLEPYLQLFHSSHHFDNWLNLFVVSDLTHEVGIISQGLLRGLNNTMQVNCLAYWNCLIIIQSSNVSLLLKFLRSYIEMLLQRWDLKNKQDLKEEEKVKVKVEEIRKKASRETQRQKCTECVERSSAPGGGVGKQRGQGDMRPDKLGSLDFRYSSRHQNLKILGIEIRGGRRQVE